MVLAAVIAGAAVLLVWHYVVPDRLRTSTRTPAQRDSLREATARTIDKIRSETEWAPRTSALCDWCEYRAHCPAFGGTRPEPAAAAAPLESQIPLALS